MNFDGRVLANALHLPIADNSVQTVITSPPYYGIRDYGIPPTEWGGQPDCQHEFSMKQVSTEIGRGNWAQGTNGRGEVQKPVKTARKAITSEVSTGFCIHCDCWKGNFGLEPTPDLYIRHIVEIFREVRRVLKPNGTLWLNLGDSYAGSWGSQGRQGHGEMTSRQSDIFRIERILMFKTPKVKAFIQGASLKGDADEQFVCYEIYITPIKHALAAEISPIIADRLFKFDGANKPYPVLEMDKPTFNIGQVELQKMTIHPSNDSKMDKHGALLQGVQVSKIHARRLFPDNPDFSLIFNAEVPKDELSFQMMGKYFKKEVYLSFEAMQRNLEFDKAPQCGFCKNPAVAQDSTKKFLCDKDVKKGVGEVVFILKKETPAQAKARVEKEVAAKTSKADDDKMDTSHINKPKGGRRNKK